LIIKLLNSQNDRRDVVLQCIRNYHLF